MSDGDSDTGFRQPASRFHSLLTGTATKDKMPKLLVGKRKLLFHFVWLRRPRGPRRGTIPRPRTDNEPEEDVGIELQLKGC